MKVFLLLLILIVNIFYGSTSREYLDQRQPGVVDLPAMGEQWPEQNFLAETEKQMNEDNNEEVVNDEGPQFERVSHEDERNEKLFSRDYFRVDSKESLERPLKAVQSNTEDEPDSHELKQYKAEIAAGDLTELFGTNPHFDQLGRYRDLGRRFVLQYPYKEVNEKKLIEDVEDNRLTPKLARPELVLAVAKESALLDAAKPVNPSEHLIQKNMLRTGKYWNTFWKEDVDPEKIMLRSSKGSKMESVRANLSPGTEIYEYVSQLQQRYPKLLYVINKNNV